MTDTETASRASLAGLTPGQLRSMFANDGWDGDTCGLALGYEQANLVVLPKNDAYDFLLFCMRNPKPCPILEVLDVGDSVSKRIAPGADIRFALPRYRVFEDGRLVSTPARVDDRWRDDLVAFLIGCSLSFESALLASGVPLRHLEQDRICPMYETTMECEPAGRFAGRTVVSMRAIPAPLVPTAIEVTARYRHAHGAPVHVGAAEQMGISKLEEPDFGESISMEPGDVPVFWACGVTPQIVAQQARPQFMISHFPACMFISDREAHVGAI
ncbi:MAG: putative hydro-lyase [Acidobacteria bacterium]|nr:putative hydro-lyase [Acidobacteriota bacterium]